MLKYAILGMVGREPMTGYDIKKAFEGTISRFWSAKHSQIYPELNELQRDGLVNCSVAIQGVKLEKKYYTLTPAGRRELTQWMRISTPIENVQKDIFRLKLYLGDYYQNSKEFAPVFRDQYAQHFQRLSELKRRVTELSEPIPERGTEEFGEYLLVRGGIRREEAYLDWMRECAELLELTLK